jgi:hypothetical protein
MNMPAFTADAAAYRRGGFYSLARRYVRSESIIVAQDLPNFGPPQPPFCTPGCSWPGRPMWQWCCRPSALGWLCWHQLAPPCPR